MLGNSWTQYLILRLLIVILQSLGPGCLVYTAWNIRTTWPAWPIANTFQAWCALEAAFFVFFLFYRRHLQRPACHPTPLTKAERNALFSKVRSEVSDPEKYFSGWFRGAKIEDIGREDVKLFLSWAFWDGAADLTPGGADDEEMEEYVTKVERMMRTPFKPGRGTARSLRLTLDPIEMECRTLLWYSLIMLADTAAHVLLRRQGFRYFKTTSTSLGVYPPRPVAVAESRYSPAKGISYWSRPHTSKTRLPVLYIHGIGVGLLPSTRFLGELDLALNSGDEDESVGILALEILQISSRITCGVLRREDFLRQLTEVLDANGYERFVLASHSYGSVLSTHILTNETLASRVAATLFVDPVTTLLHLPDVAYNFTARKPKSASEWLLWYFASKDPNIAHTLGRHFFWSQNVLWRDRALELVQRGMKITASLASHDLIVDAQAVGTYLTEHQVDAKDSEKLERVQTEASIHASDDKYGTADAWKHRSWDGVGLEVIWWEGLDHGQVFDQPSTRLRLVDVLIQYSREQ